MYILELIKHQPCTKFRGSLKDCWCKKTLNSAMNLFTLTSKLPVIFKSANHRLHFLALFMFPKFIFGVWMAKTVYLLDPGFVVRRCNAQRCHSRLLKGTLSPIVPQQRSNDWHVVLHSFTFSPSLLLILPLSRSFSHSVAVSLPLSSSPFVEKRGLVREKNLTLKFY